MHSTRGTGDALQSILEDHFNEILGEEIKDYSTDFNRRAMADLAFKDSNGLYYVVDVKTHRLETDFNMPNLTSVDRLARFYEDDNNCFAILMIAYKMQEMDVRVERVHFLPIEFIAWSCLTIGALGWGQIQIANSNRIEIKAGYSRKTWMLELCDALDVFYPREIAKISQRVSRFELVREVWKKKEDIWA